MRDFRDKIDWIEKPSKETIEWAIRRLKELNLQKEQVELPPSGDSNSLTDNQDCS